MPSFDVVSDFNRHEVANAVDQSNREVTTRFDFKGSNSKFILEENSINLISQSEFQLQQMLDMLTLRNSILQIKNIIQELLYVLAEYTK